MIQWVSAIIVAVLSLQFSILENHYTEHALQSWSSIQSVFALELKDHPQPSEQVDLPDSLCTVCSGHLQFGQIDSPVFSVGQELFSQSFLNVPFRIIFQKKVRSSLWATGPPFLNC